MKEGVLGDILLAVLWAIITFYNFYALLVYEHTVWSHNSFMLGMFFAGTVFLIHRAYRKNKEDSYD